jgi:methionyl-tRNA synthetase
MSRAFYVTTPIYYVNAEPHIGHTYTTVVADTVARYHRLAGEQTFFLTGTDEHGEKIAEVAAETGTTPLSVADRYSAAFRGTWDRLGFSYDCFIRTTDERHKQVVQSILQKVYDAGGIEFREYEGVYCVGCERFLSERDLVNGLCRDHERPPEHRRESNYFFKQTEHFEWLADYIGTHADFIRPDRYRNEVLGMLREDSGLGDLSISRPKERLEWGIELPFDRNYVCYVWFDALINYLTGIGYPDGPDFATLWASAQHYIAKDILKPHAVFWPCMLRAIGLPPPRHVNVHGYWTVEGRKMSKSLGNIVAPLDMQEKFGFDCFRYFLLRDMAFGADSDFSESALVARVNADLANNLGNLLSRTLNMTGRYTKAAVPEPGSPGPAEDAVAAAAARSAAEVDEHVRRNEFHRALESIFNFTDTVNRYVERQAPWKVAKAKEAGGEKRLGTILYTACEALRVVALLIAPFLPDTAPRMLASLGIPDALEGARLPDDAARWGALEPGTATVRGAPLFPRIEPRPGDA